MPDIVSRYHGEKPYLIAGYESAGNGAAIETGWSKTTTETYRRLYLLEQSWPRARKPSRRKPFGIPCSVRVFIVWHRSSRPAPGGFGAGHLLHLAGARRTACLAACVLLGPGKEHYDTLGVRRPESVRWLIEHPLPIFLCVVKKAEAKILVYRTTPRFAAWALPHKNQLELIPGTQKKAQTSEWVGGDTFKLAAPILSFTIRDILKTQFREHVSEVLKFWIGCDVENLFRKSRVASPGFKCPTIMKQTR